ncbi:hypothetical protein Bca4012_063559 [Brassica carinata]|uniref:Uncharacterized protein n=1 Tax=Brassica carinata TaxID=52824 RepID=A0A8X7SDE3_BRACI|nr:hypothetical protein Bca52824_033156 [Brassica carinata]
MTHEESSSGEGPGPLPYDETLTVAAFIDTIMKHFSQQEVAHKETADQLAAIVALLAPHTGYPSGLT